MKLLLPAAAALLIIPSAGSALTQSDGPPKQSPEIQQLGYYVGSWEGHGETKAGPFGPAGKLSSHMTCKWFAGGFQIVCEGEEMGPRGKRGFLNIIAYDEKTKAYTEYSISSLGESEYDPAGSLVGNKLTFLVDQDIGGKPAKFRYAETRVSPVLMTYRAEVATKPGAWTLLAEGQIEKVK